MKNNGFPPSAASGTNSPTLHSATPAVGQRQCAPQHEVSGSLRRAITDQQADAERELHIKSCTYLMEQAWADYEASGCLGDRGTADRWRILRDEAVKARSPQQIARMEQERGLA